MVARSLLATALPLLILVPSLPALDMDATPGPAPTPLATVPTAQDVAARDAPVPQVPYAPEASEPTGGFDLVSLLSASFGRLGAQTGAAMADAARDAGAR